MHEGFPKGEFAIWLGHPMNGFEHYDSIRKINFYEKPIGVDDNSRPYVNDTDATVNFYVADYFEDFKIGVEKYYQQLLDNEHPKLVDNFKQAARITF